MRIPKMRRAISAAAAATLVGVSMLVSSAPASADVTKQDTCVRGEVCVYDELRGLIASSTGNIPGPIGPLPAGGWIENRGWKDPGYDHIKATIVPQSGSSYTICLHYPGDDTPTGTSIPNKASIKNIRWVNAC
ncbi:hypothetical protein AB0B28_00345 [Glycomyces sp. NPDC046736]|uniref:hypothetical protein n=1 Tax=Glycomyces sp. NPDC046736 TaxID=3155615 RepID=UPI0033C6F10A